VNRRLRRALIVAVTLAAALVAALPVILTVALGWYRTDALKGPFGPDTDIYVILPLLYVVWLPATMAGMVFLYDRLGYRYMVTERKQTPTRKERRRRRAGLSLAEAQDRARKKKKD